MARRPAAARRERQPTVVGREPELERLRRSLLSPPAVVVAVGEAGVGKTRLLAEALELPELAGRERLVGRCHPLRAPFPLGGVIDALRHLRYLPGGGARSADATAWRRYLPELRRLLPVPEAGPIRGAGPDLLDGLLELLERMGPAVLVLEDHQWWDRAGTDLVRRLVPRLPSDAVLVVTRRGGGADEPELAELIAPAPPGTTVERLTVEPLGAAAVGAMAAASSSLEVSEELATALWTRTGGLPRLVELVLGQLSKSDLLGHRGADLGGVLAGLGVPQGLADEVLSYLAPLGDDELRVASSVAVLGSPADATAVGGVSGLPVITASQALSALVAGGVLMRSDAAFGFRAPLASQALYSSIPGPERRRYHRAAAAWLGSKRARPWAELARHHREGGEVAAWVRSVDLATTGLSDPAGAVELLREVVLEPRLGPGTRSRLAVRLGTAALRAETPAVARPLLQTVVDERGLTGVRCADVRWSLGCLHLAVGDADGWRDQRVAAAHDLSHLPSRAALVMMELAMPWVEHGRFDEHRLWLERAAAAADRQSDPVVKLCVGVAGALVPLYTGDPAAWRAIDAIRWDAPSHGERLQLIWAAQNLAGACFHLGHYARARSLYDEGARRAAELGRAEFDHVLRAADISLAWAAGQWSGLDDAARRYVQEFADLPGWTLHGKLVLGNLLVARGELDPAERLLREAAEAARLAGAIPVIATAAGGLARISMFRGDPEAAHAEATEAVELLSRKGIWAWAAPVAPLAVEAAVASGRLTDASDLVRRFARGLAGRDAPHAVSALRLCEGVVAAGAGDHAEAAARLDDAVRAYRALPRPHDAAGAMAQRGVSLSKLGDPRAPEALAEALAIYESLDASVDAGRVRRMLRERSVAVPQPWRGGRSGYGSRLSPREQSVIELAAAGRTNEQIAHDLFISRRTVEDRLSSAMRKLGVASKRDLRARKGGWN